MSTPDSSEQTTARSFASRFASPPPEYGLVMWWGWSGPMADAVIERALDDMRSHGVAVVLIGAGYDVEPMYLSEGWFERIRFAVNALAGRDMRVWLADEGTYPSGFAGGLFSSDFPELRMKGLAAGEKIPLLRGERIRRELPPRALGALAVERATGRSLALASEGGILDWRAEDGDWDLSVVGWEYRTSPTRYVHHPRHVKDTTYSLCDYLDPAATHAFLAAVHDRYTDWIGADYGKTVLGFFGDEPDYGFLPWTPAMPERFAQRKGYDLLPSVPLLFSPSPDDRTLRVKADFWDVWSDLFRDNFVKPQADWCAARGMRYVMHLNHEDRLDLLVRSEGDYFKGMRYVHVPAVDAIWRQVWMDRTADFPKLASSAAHLYGKARCFCETFAIYGTGLTLEQARWVIDHQLARGISTIMTAFYSSHPGPHEGWPVGSPQYEQFGLLASYTHRLSYLLSQGRPAAEVALYLPTQSMWLGDERTGRATLDLAASLLSSQRDFDFVDEQALTADLELRNGSFVSASGGVYRAVLVPQCKAISRAAVERLARFASQGGSVVLFGEPPTILFGTTFIGAENAPALGWAMHEPAVSLTDAVLRALPAPDLLMEPACPEVRYLHRVLEDGDLYYIFNQGAAEVSARVTLAGTGAASLWDAGSGSIRNLSALEVEDGRVTLPLTLRPWEAVCLLVGPEVTGAEGGEPPAGTGRTLVELSSSCEMQIAGRTISAPLKEWADLGLPGYSGRADYGWDFSLPADAVGGRARLFLECGTVLYSACLSVNGRDLGHRAWRPFAWEITGIARPGANHAEIRVYNTAAPAFMGDPARRAALEREAAKGGYLAFTFPMDLQMLPSGLLTPVRIVAYG